MAATAPITSAMGRPRAPAPPSGTVVSGEPESDVVVSSSNEFTRQLGSFRQQSMALAYPRWWLKTLAWWSRRRWSS